MEKDPVQSQSKSPSKPLLNSQLANHHFKKDIQAEEKHAKNVKKQVDSELKILKQKITQEYKKTILTAKKAKKTIIKGKNISKTYIKKHPFLSVAAAAMAGALLAQLLRKRK